MNPTNTSLTERVANSIKQLSLVATELNSASDELGKAITAIDTVLQALNIGIATWITTHSEDGLPETSSYWSRQIGYSKVGNRWGISLRTTSGSLDSPDEDDTESWLFNDAPRWLRIESVEKIPDLLEAIVVSTETTTKTIKAKTAEANQLATAIAQAAGKKPAPTNPSGIIGEVLAAESETRRESMKDVSERISTMARILEEMRPDLPKYAEIISEVAAEAETKPTRGGK